MHTRHDENLYKIFSKKIQIAIIKRFPAIKSYLKPINLEFKKETKKVKLVHDGHSNIIDNYVIVNLNFVYKSTILHHARMKQNCVCNTAKSHPNCNVLLNYIYESNTFTHT